MRRAVAGGAEERAAVSHAVQERAAEDIQRRIFADGSRVARGTLGQGGCRPRLCHLVLGDALVEIAVAVGAPKLVGSIHRLVGMVAAIAVDAIARVALVAVRRNIRVILSENHAVLCMEPVQDVREGAAGNGQCPAVQCVASRRVGFTHGRVKVTLGAADRSGSAVAIGVDPGNVDAARILRVQKPHSLERALSSLRISQIFSDTDMAAATPAEGYGYGDAGLSQDCVAAVQDLDVSRQIRVPVGAAKRIEQGFRAGEAARVRVSGDTDCFPPASRPGRHVSAELGPGDRTLDVTVCVFDRELVESQLRSVLHPVLVIGVGAQGLVRIFRDAILNFYA